MRWVFFGAGHIVQSIVPFLKKESRSLAFYSPSGKSAEIAANLCQGTVIRQLDALPDADVYVIACKPQQFAELAEKLRGKLNTQVPVLSVMAAISVDTIKQALGQTKVMRLMPNTPSAIGKGVGLLYTPTGIDHLHWKRILTPIGNILTMESEEQLDFATTVTGCGPGFIFEWARHWQQQLMEFGVDEATARSAIAHLFYGSACMMHSSTLAFEELRKQVTSKGGVTAAAIEVMNSPSHRSMVKEMTKAALTRLDDLKQVLGNS